MDLLWKDLDLHVPQYKGGFFRIPNLKGWTVVVTGPKFIEEVRRAPEDQLSFEVAVEEVGLTPNELLSDRTFRLPGNANPLYVRG